MDDIANPDIVGAAKAITSKSLSSIELTEHMLRRIALVDPHLKAFVEVLADRPGSPQGQLMPRLETDVIAARCMGFRSPSRRSTTSRA